MNVASGNRRSPTAPDATESEGIRAGVITGIVLTGEQTLHQFRQVQPEVFLNIARPVGVDPVLEAMLRHLVREVERWQPTALKPVVEAAHPEFVLILL